MLDKSKLLYLNKNQKYDEIYDIFVEEYKSIITKFLDERGVQHHDEAPILYYIEIIRKNFGKRYEDALQRLTDIFVDEKIDSQEAILYAIDSYKYVINKFKAS